MVRCEWKNNSMGLEPLSCQHNSQLVLFTLQNSINDANNRALVGGALSFKNVFWRVSVTKLQSGWQ